jgi:ubiquinone/menaquinone biosynthesis C-methylase UbiE
VRVAVDPGDALSEPEASGAAKPREAATSPEASSAAKPRESQTSAFDARASSYALWPELVRGETRHRVLERLEPVTDEVLLDLGSGPGAMARAAGPFVQRVVLCDLSPAMLGAAAIESRRASRLVPPRVAGDAASLPFRDGSFDLIACRHAARLFASPSQAAGEMHRVLRRGGRVAICDVMATGDADVDRVLISLEEMLAPCPVTLLTPAAWGEQLAHGGFRRDWDDQPLAELEAGRSWNEACARCGVAQSACDEGKRLLLDAPAAARQALGVLAHGSDVVYHPPYGIVGATRV